MIKVAIYFNNKNISLDLSKPELGNPGIGGTQFNFITLPFFFQQYLPNQVDWFFVSHKPSRLPTCISQIVIDDIRDLKETLGENSIDYFIWKPGYDDRVIHEIPDHIKSIAWCNNVPGPETLDILSSAISVRKVVFAGHEALDLIRDHKIIEKSTVIYNGIDVAPYKDSGIQKDHRSVVFLGGLTPPKCFHLFAQIWTNIIQEIPDARLTVIGSGALYNHNERLGKFRLAEENYEEKFIRPLLTDEGEIHPSVHFTGLLGIEKIQLLQKALIGVINPHGKSEVCPGSAMEFQACCTPVIGGARYGNLDVVKNGVTGYLVNNQKQLIKRILFLLRNPDHAIAMGLSGREWIVRKFNQPRIVQEWHSLFLELNSGHPIGTVHPMKSNWLYNGKILFEMLRIIKFKLGVFRRLPAIFQIIERRKTRKAR